MDAPGRPVSITASLSATRPELLQTGRSPHAVVRRVRASANTAAAVMFAPKFSHITPILMINECIEYKTPLTHL